MNVDEYGKSAGRLFIFLAFFFTLACSLPLIIRKSVPAEEILHFRAPAHRSFYAGQKGMYTISYEDHVDVIDAFQATHAGPVSRLKIEIHQAEHDRKLEVRPPRRESKYKIGSLRGIAIAQFDIQEPATYQLLAYYEKNEEFPITLAVSYQTSLDNKIQAGIVIVLLVVNGALGIALLLWATRELKNR